MERHIALDAHAKSCTFAVVSESGKRLKSAVVETNGRALIEFIKSVPGRTHVCLEEGTQSGWLYEILSPHVDEIIVTHLDQEDHGRKDDLTDAFAQAEQLDGLQHVKKDADKQLIECSHKHAIARTLETCPGLGPIRVAQLIATIITPHRFRGARQLWAYSGLGIVMRSSSDWVMTSGGWQRAELNKTRGLNRNYNRRLKAVFKGGATAMLSDRMEPLYADYTRITEQGTKPPMAKLTLARKIAATVLAMFDAPVQCE